MLINVTNLQTKLFQERNNRVILKGISLVLYIHTNIINFKLLHENSVLGITKTTRFNVSDPYLAKPRLVKHHCFRYYLKSIQGHGQKCHLRVLSCLLFTERHTERKQNRLADTQ